MSTIIDERLSLIQKMTLTEAAHNSIEAGACVMEAAAYIAGEPWTDHPDCVSPVIAAFCRSWNDTPEPYGSPIRERLKVYLPRLVGSRGTDAQEESRSWLACDWLIRTALPAWLRAAGLTEHADRLANLPPHTSRDALRDSATTGAAAGAAARDAAWATEGTAARAAARATVGAAARAAARDAVEAAAWTAAWDAAWDAAWAAAWAAAWDAAWAAVGYAAGYAVGYAAEEKLSPVVEELQSSAWDLLDRMLAVTEGASS